MENENKEVIPKMTDKNWTTYVLSLMEDDEIYNGLPKAEGLRRICRLLIGEPESTPVPLQMLFEKGKLVSCVMQAKIRIICKDKNDYDISREYSDVAEVNTSNTKEDFLPYFASAAFTKAEGRTLKKILGLKILTAEEVPSNYFDKQDINSNQIAHIDLFCKKNNIDVLKFINSSTKKYEKIDNVSFETAGKMIKELNEYNKESKKIPDSIIGYNNDWRK